jgi:hypothetical protein
MLTGNDLTIQNIPFFKELDVLVVGGGTAGVVAGIASARQGMKTLIVEQFGFLGGTQTGALVTPMMPNQIDFKPLNGGIDYEINLRANKMHQSGVWKDGNRGWFNPEMLKYIYDRMVTEAGCEILFYTMFEDAILEDPVVKGVTILNKGGRKAITAKRIIDCTGDADVASRAGVPTESGDPETGKNQPFSLRFLLGNIDLAKFADYLKSLGKPDVMDSADGTDVPLIHSAMVWDKGWTLEPLFRQAVRDGALKEADGNYFQVFTMAGRPGELAFNCPRISGNVDGTSPGDLSDAAIRGREAIQRYVTFCRKYLPGCEDSYLVMSAPMIGVRESRRILGEYYLTEDDVLNAKKFPDAIARSNYPIDIHRDGQEDKLKLQNIKEGDYYEIPYRSLVPLKIDNLLVAGRCFSGSFVAQSSARVQTNCRAMGEAAGVAAALSIRNNQSLRSLDGPTLRANLIELGGFLD